MLQNYKIQFALDEHSLDTGSLHLLNHLPLLFLEPTMVI